MIRRNVDVMAAVLILLAVAVVSHVRQPHVRFSNVSIEAPSFHTAVLERFCSLGNFFQ